MDLFFNVWGLFSLTNIIKFAIYPSLNLFIIFLCIFVKHLLYDGISYIIYFIISYKIEKKKSIKV